MSKNIAESKSILAKLLATENITVRHLDVQSASFDTLNRVLTCPIWKDMESELYDLVMGHEVGHALHTPNSGWMQYGEKYGAKRLGFLNVVEDARIEKLIKRTFPGIRKSFTIGYKSLFDRDFFGISRLKGDTSKLNLIDRINMHFKCGSHLVIKFTDEEREFVKMTEAAETFADAVEVTNKIWEYVKENEQDKLNNEQDLSDLLKALAEGKIEAVPAEDGMEMPEPQSGKDSDSEESDDEDDADGESSSDDDSDDSEEESEKKSSKKSKSKSDEDDEESEDDSEDADAEGDSAEDSDDEEDSEEKDDKAGHEGGQGGTPADPESITENAHRKNESKLVDENAKPYILLDLPECDLKKTIVPTMTIVTAFEQDCRTAMANSNRFSVNKKPEERLDYDTMSNDLLKLFVSRNNRYVALLVKEFEMRKNAKQYSRQLESKSGELDTRRLDRYRFTNDIFRKVIETPKGKSHGMIMFVDMSSSMSSVIRNTMEQAAVLAIFCKKVGIPFRIYGFSDNMVSYNMVSYVNNKFIQKTPAAFGLNSQNFHLKELITSDLNTRDFKRAMAMMIMFGTTYYYYYYGIMNDAEVSKILKDFRMSSNAGQMGLSGTPFIETLVASKAIIKKFKADTHVDITNVIYLTDGEGGYGITMPPLYGKYYAHDHNRCTIGYVDPDTKMRVMVTPGAGNRPQAAITRLVRECTGCRHIGFYVGSKAEIQNRLNSFNKKDLPMDNSEFIKLEKSFKEDDYFSVPALGYDTYYYIALAQGGVQDEEMKVRAGSTKYEIEKSFNKMIDKKHSNRALVSSFASEIAA